MKQVFRKREDETVDLLDSIVIEDEIPEGYVELPTKSDRKDDGTQLSKEELEELEVIKNRPPEKTPLELLQETVDQLVLDNLMRGL